MGPSLTGETDIPQKLHLWLPSTSPPIPPHPTPAQSPQGHGNLRFILLSRVGRLGHHRFKSSAKIRTGNETYVNSSTALSSQSPEYSCGCTDLSLWDKAMGKWGPLRAYSPLQPQDGRWWAGRGCCIPGAWETPRAQQGALNLI